MLVLADDRRLGLEAAGRRAFQGEPPGHAQMRHPGLAGRQGEQQIFGPPVQPQHRRPLQQFDEPLGKGKAQVGTVLARRAQARALQNRLQAATDGFDFGQFRHGAEVAAATAPEKGPRIAPAFSLPMKGRERGAPVTPLSRPRFQAYLGGTTGKSPA
ncbi:hypothetical protein D3C77_315740 [compost metagenome]